MPADTMTGAPVVDAHHHLWDLALTPQSWIAGPDMAPIARDFTTDDLEAALEPTAVRTTVLVQAMPSTAESQWLLKTAATTDLVAGVVAWVDLTRSDVKHQVEALRQGPGGDLLAGIRHPIQSEPDTEWINQASVHRGLRALAELDLPFDLLVLPHQLHAAARAAHRLPDVRFVLDHCAKPPIARGEMDGWAASLRDLAASPNVVCKLSGLVTEADWHKWTVQDLSPYVETVLEAFGPSRLMFGSDWPVCLLAAGYERVLDAAGHFIGQLSIEEQADVWRRTATIAYGLERRSAA